MREHFPQYIPVLRIFYGQQTTVRLHRPFGPAVAVAQDADADDAEYEVLVQRDGDGGATPDPAARPRLIPILSCRGGQQGCSAATHFVLCAYHLALHEVQARHPSTRIAAIADDTQLNDRPDALSPAFDTKREVSRARCGHESNLEKVLAYTPSGDPALIPSHLPGSPEHASQALRGPLRGFKAAGCYFGDSAWRIDQLQAQLTKRLANLDAIDRLRDSEFTRNVGQLRYTLIRQVASQIPNYWARAMMPSLTRAPIAHANERVRESFERLVSADASPAALRDMAWQQAMLPSSLGGASVGYSESHRRRYL